MGTDPRADLSQQAAFEQRARPASIPVMDAPARPVGMPVREWYGLTMAQKMRLAYPGVKHAAFMRDQDGVLRPVEELTPFTQACKMYRGNAHMGAVE